MTTFARAVAASTGWAAKRVVATTAAIVIPTTIRRIRLADALWAPSWATGNGLASSLPEHRAWVAVTECFRRRQRTRGRAWARAQTRRAGTPGMGAGSGEPILRG